jgi:hypothetical protein
LVVPETPRIALAAIAVTGLVGVAAPLITWQAARSGERASASTARQLADLAELRSVLDSAIFRLDRLQLSVQLEMVTWESGAPTSRHRAKHLATDRAYTAFLEQDDRLILRIGETKVARLYRAAGGGFFGGSLIMYGANFPSRVKAFAKEFDDAGVAKLRFEAAARGLVGSKLAPSR